MVRESCLYALQVMCESFSEIVIDLEGPHSSGGSRSSSKGGDLYISYLWLPGVRYLAVLSSILNLYSVKNDNNTRQCMCQ